MPRFAVYVGEPLVVLEMLETHTHRCSLSLAAAGKVLWVDGAHVVRVPLLCRDDEEREGDGPPTVDEQEGAQRRRWQAVEVDDGANDGARLEEGAAWW